MSITIDARGNRQGLIVEHVKRVVLVWIDRLMPTLAAAWAVVRVDSSCDDLEEVLGFFSLSLFAGLPVRLPLGADCRFAFAFGRSRRSMASPS